MVLVINCHHVNYKAAFSIAYPVIKMEHLTFVPLGKICRGSGSSPFMRCSFIVLQY